MNKKGLWIRWYISVLHPFGNHCNAISFRDHWTS